MCSMKTLIYFCLLLIFLPMPFYGNAEVTLPVDPPTTIGDPIVEPFPHRHRIPPAPIMCFIDMEEGTVTFSSSVLDEIDSYQIYDESGKICLGAYDNAADFTTALTDLTGGYCLKFLTPKGTYTGYINL